MLSYSIEKGEPSSLYLPVSSQCLRCSRNVCFKIKWNMPFHSLRAMFPKGNSFLNIHVKSDHIISEYVNMSFAGSQYMGKKIRNSVFLS